MFTFFDVFSLLFITVACSIYASKGIRAFWCFCASGMSLVAVSLVVNSFIAANVRLNLLVGGGVGAFAGILWLMWYMERRKSTPTISE